MDLKESYQKSGKRPRRTKIVNLYDNKLEEGYPWQGTSIRVQRVIQDMEWKSIIRERVLIVGDINAHNTIWNPHCRQPKNAGSLEELIEGFELIVNNNTDFPTRLSSQGISIIDLALISPELGVFQVWGIFEEYPSLSDHRLILIEWEDIEVQGLDKQQIAMTGWSINNLLEDKELLQVAKNEWIIVTKSHAHLDPFVYKRRY